MELSAFKPKMKRRQNIFFDVVIVLAGLQYDKTNRFVLSK